MQFTDMEVKAGESYNEQFKMQSLKAVLIHFLYDQ